MKQVNPKISIVMPAYNAERFIAMAIDSILAQTFAEFEYIIIDDASTDKTADIIKSYQEADSRIRYTKNDVNQNIARSLNKGIMLAQTDLIARMDADDIAHPDRLKLQYDLLNKNPNLAIVGTNIEIINEEGEALFIRKYPTNSHDLKKRMFRYSAFAHPTVMFRKSVAQKYGYYNPKYSPTEDLDLWFKLGAHNEFASIPQSLLKYRVFKDSSSHKTLRRLELLVFEIRLKAIVELGYKPTLYDALYNLLQFSTLWIMPTRARIWLYNFLRGKELI